MKLLYIGGFYLPNFEDRIQKIAKKNIPLSANTFEWAYIDGLLNHYNDIRFLSFPFLPNFPNGLNKIYTSGDKQKIHNVNFISFFSIRLPFINLIVRCFLLIWYLLLNMRYVYKRTVIVYTPHIPFLLPLAIFKHIFSLKIVLIVPDLPIYTSSNTSFFYRKLKYIENYIFQLLLKFVDGLVTVTDEMTSLFTYLSIPIIRIEGMYKFKETDSQNIKKNDNIKTIIYAGSLDARYGLKNLIAAFLQMKNNDYKLWIYGNGDLKEYIQKIAKKYINISYFGLVPHEIILGKIASADILVNPRTPEGEYTKYSFPIKTMEYLASGTPCVMYDLPGLPDEYKKHLYLVHGCSVNELKEKIEYVLKLPADIIKNHGDDAINFIKDFKTPEVQIIKLCSLLDKLAIEYAVKI